MRTPRVGTRKRFEPVGLDVWDARANTPERGEVVTVVQPYGCPRNGTMGHCYVEGPSKGLALVLVASLQPVGGA